MVDLSNPACWLAWLVGLKADQDQSKKIFSNLVTFNENFILKLHFKI
jgi:hypothetical protein